MQKMEKWKDINDYEDLYQISNTGKVRTKEKSIKLPLGQTRVYPSKIVKNCLRGNQICCSLTINKRTINPRIKELVYTHFIGKITDGAAVSHLDMDLANNRVDNLFLALIKIKIDGSQKEKFQKEKVSEWDKITSERVNDLNVKYINRHLSYKTDFDKLMELDRLEVIDFLTGRKN